MHLSHFATRRLALLAALSLGLAACSDSTAPDAPFDPVGTSEDVAAANAAFEAPAVASYSAMADEIKTLVGGSASASLAAVPSGPLAMRELASQVARNLAVNFSAAGPRPNFATSAVPAEYAGKTFEYDLQAGHYVMTDRAGAPSNGVRFILYAINPLTGQPTDPLTEIGYMELTASESSTTSSVSAKVVSDGVTYLSYTVTATLTSSSSGTIQIGGFVSNGTERVNFDLTISVTGGSDGGFVTNYLLSMPNRNFSISVQASMPFASDTATIRLEARGRHGRVTLEGELSDAGKSLTVKVNGDLFATITVTGSTMTIVGADGQPLTADEQQTLERLLGVFDDGLGFFNGLVTPGSAI